MSFHTPDMDYVMELEASNNMTSTMSPNATGVFVRYTWTAFLATFYPMALSVDRYVTPVLFLFICNKQMFRNWLICCLSAIEDFVHGVDVTHFSTWA
jgi:hypothetical protein